MWVPGIDLGLPGLTVSAFTYPIFSPVLDVFVSFCEMGSCVVQAGLEFMILYLSLLSIRIIGIHYYTQLQNSPL